MRVRLTNRRSRVAVAALFLLAAGTGTATAEDREHTIAFAAGASSATMHQSLVRGDSDIYKFSASAGQQADIRLTSLEDNASMMIYGPPASVSRGADGLDIDGAYLPGGDVTPGLDPGATRHWGGALPANGEYLIHVGGDRGNATYDLTVSIR